MNDSQFLASFRHWRRKGLRATAAMTRAYGDTFTGAKRYAPLPVETGYGRPRQPWNTPGDGRRLRYVESPAEIGARDVGSWDEIARAAGRRADHTGWYCDSDQRETYAGHVLQIPGRNGRPRFLAAFKSEYGFTVELDPIEGEPGDCYNTAPADQGAIDAARRGDSLAESHAEDARDYDSAWQAGARWNDLRDTIKSARRDFLALIRDAKSKCGALGKDSPLFLAVKGTLESLAGEIRDARQEQGELANGDAESLYFYAGDSKLRAAFNEGAGREVLA